MVEYICPRCNYKTKDKSRYINHLKRKIICENINNVLDLNDEYIKYNLNINLENNTEITQKNTSLSQKTTKLECKYCNKIFSRVDSLGRHLKKCKEKKVTIMRRKIY